VGADTDGEHPGRDQGGDRADSYEEAAHRGRSVSTPWRLRATRNRRAERPQSTIAPAARALIAAARAFFAEAPDSHVGSA
jgi:hypothetical protein